MHIRMQLCCIRALCASNFGNENVNHTFKSRLSDLKYQDTISWTIAEFHIFREICDCHLAIEYRGMVKKACPRLHEPLAAGRAHATYDPLSDYPCRTGCVMGERGALSLGHFQLSRGRQQTFREWGLISLLARVVLGPVKSEWREQHVGTLVGRIRISHFWFLFFKPLFEHWTGGQATPANWTERQCWLLIHPINAPRCCSRHSDF